MAVLRHRGRSKPVRIFLDELSDADAASVAAAMRDVAMTGVSAAHHLRGDILEVRADGDRQAYRLLFAPEGRDGQILLALEGFLEEDPEDPASEDRVGREEAG